MKGVTMDAPLSTEQYQQRITTNENRKKLLEGLPISEHLINLAGISTAVLVGGQGPPVILLHGPGETSLWWMRVIPKLVKTHRVIVPDLRGHGAPSLACDKLNTELGVRW